MVEMAEMPGFFKVNLVAGNIYMTERFSKFFILYFFQNLVETATKLKDILRLPQQNQMANHL